MIKLLITTLFVAVPVHAENRSIDGTGNATDNRGAAGQAFIRLAPADYGDGSNSPNGESRPNPRTISNLLSAQVGSRPNRHRRSDFIWQWGQFVDHDLTLSAANSGEEASIAVPETTDLLFPVIPLERTRYLTDLEGVRQQINNITSFHDASMVYGSDATRAAALRSFTHGKLRVDLNNLLPFNDTGLPMDSQGALDPEALRLAGDPRANEQPGLTALHTLFVREHNRLASIFAAENPALTDEELYQKSRKWVGAIIQSITYHEWLPALLGPHAPVPGDFRYDPDLDPRLSNEFATALFRFGHTLVSSQLMRIANNGFPDATPSMEMRELFFEPSTMNQPGTLALVLKGLACQRHQEADLLLTDDLRNALFGPPGSGGLDLVALNIQRGREHGLPDYNTVRSLLGLAPATTWADLTDNATLQSHLDDLYPSIDDLDLWIGGLAESHLEGSALGELLTTALASEFTRLAQSDAFFYLWDHDLSPADRALISSTSLSEMIRRNTSLTQIQPAVFFLPPPTGFPKVLLTHGPEGQPLLHFMGDPDFTYNYRQSTDLSSWSSPMLVTPAHTSDSMYFLTLSDESGPGHRFYQLLRSPKLPE